MGLSEELRTLFDGLGDRSRHALLTLLEPAAQALDVPVSQRDAKREWFDPGQLIEQMEATRPCPPHHPINAVFSSVSAQAEGATARTVWVSGGLRSTLEVASAVSRYEKVTAIHVGRQGERRTGAVQRLCHHFGASLRVFDNWDDAEATIVIADMAAGGVSRQRRLSPYADYSYAFLRRASIRLRMPFEFLHCCVEVDRICGVCFGCLEYQRLLALDDPEFDGAAPSTNHLQIGSEVPIVFLVGRSLSGSTALAMALGACSSVLNVGELGKLPELIVARELCTCGLEFAQCPFWRKFLNVLPPLRLAREAIAATDQDAWMALYVELSRRNGGAIVLDASKDPRRALALRRGASNAKVIHLTRSPIDTIDSDRRHRGAHWPSHRTLAAWMNVHHFILKNFADDPKNYLRVKFEDFVRRPDEVVSRCAAFMGTVSSDASVSLRKGHHVGGNRVDAALGVVAPSVSPRPHASADGELLALMAALDYPYDS
jgi:hypothetical protein